MVTVNHNYLKLPGSYLFSTIAKKVKAYKEANPQANVISLDNKIAVCDPVYPVYVAASPISSTDLWSASMIAGARGWVTSPIPSEITFACGSGDH